MNNLCGKSCFHSSIFFSRLASVVCWHVPLTTNSSLWVLCLRLLFFNIIFNQVICTVRCCCNSSCWYFAVWSEICTDHFHFTLSVHYYRNTTTTIALSWHVLWVHVYESRIGLIPDTTIGITASLLLSKAIFTNGTEYNPYRNPRERQQVTFPPVL